METLLTVDELAGKLKISRVYLYKLVRLKRIPYFHINKAVRFSPAEINAWLQEKRGQEYHRDKGKDGARGEGWSGESASIPGKDNRSPVPNSGAQNEAIEIIK